MIYGLKAKVDKKDYKKLTSKNYEQLPEIKKKKEDAQKKAEVAERMKTKKAYEQVTCFYSNFLYHSIDYIEIES